MAKSAPTLDAIDRRILQVLQAEGRLPIVALADRVGLSPSPCARRLAKLEESGVIARYAAILDPARIGLALQAFVLVALNDHAEPTVAAFQRAVSLRPEVLAAYAVSGEMDYLLHVVAADMEAFADFATRDLLRMPGVRASRTSFVLKALKPPSTLPV